jgi:hypothetical protein
MSNIDYEIVADLRKEMKEEEVEAKMEFGKLYGALSAAGEDGQYAALATFDMMSDLANQFYNKSVKELTETLSNCEGDE